MARRTKRSIGSNYLQRREPTQGRIDGTESKGKKHWQERGVVSRPSSARAGFESGFGFGFGFRFGCGLPKNSAKPQIGGTMTAVIGAVVAIIAALKSYEQSQFIKAQRLNEHEKLKQAKIITSKLEKENEDDNNS